MAVCNVVRAKVAEDARWEAAASGLEEGEDHVAAERRRMMAQRLEPLIGRKVVKQVVMTTVYGVTHLGARDQILRQLKALPELEDCSVEELKSMANYLAKHTLNSLENVSQGMMYAMKWLRNTASVTVKHSKRPLQWTTPLGLPVVQPYLKEEPLGVRSVAGTEMTVDVSLDSPDGEPDTRKSATAFPPNFVHSLDSSHMMMTANACAEVLTYYLLTYLLAYYLLTYLLTTYLPARRRDSRSRPSTTPFGLTPATWT